MLKNAEKVEDSIRDRIQQAKDETWDEFSEQIADIRDAMNLLTESNKQKDCEIAELKQIIEMILAQQTELKAENLLLKQKN